MKTDPSSARPIVAVTRLAPLRKSITALLVASLMSGCAALSNPDDIKLNIPANTSDFTSRLYAGAAMGSSRLSPNTRGEGFSVDSESDAGTQLRLGYDVHNMLSVEVDTSVLGTSQLRGQNAAAGQTGEVKYSAATFSALVYGWSGVQNRSRREGLSAYGRLGFSALSKSSNVPEIEESGAVPIVGIGAEYGFVNGLGIRSEITRFDSDVTYIGFGAVYRFGISPMGIGRLVAKAAEPGLAGANPDVSRRGGSSQETVVERYAGSGARPAGGRAPHLHYNSGAEPDARYVGSMADRWRPAMRAGDRDVDGVMDGADSCPDTANHVTVDRYGCGLFDAVLHEVTFKSGSRWLTPRARGQLDLLGETLLAFPESRVQVRAHTDSLGPADMNLGLSSRRAEVVVQYLQSRGVNELQLQAVGMGEAQPLDSNQTLVGRKRNRRVDIVTLPDQDAGQLLFAANVPSNVVMTVQDSSASQGQLAGTLAVNNDEWNSRIHSNKSSNAPALLAALPAPDKRSTRTKIPVTGDRLVPRVEALPQPGYAPDFQVDGVLKGVSFAQGNSTVSQDSKEALQPLVNALTANRSVTVAIMAHTDNQGGTDDNKALSTKRAQSVVEYLVEQGVSPARLKAEGYGELLPLVQNVTEADKERNRRIEVRVLQDNYR